MHSNSILPCLFIVVIVAFVAWATWWSYSRPKSPKKRLLGKELSFYGELAVGCAVKSTHALSWGQVGTVVKIEYFDNGEFCDSDTLVTVKFGRSEQVVNHDALTRVPSVVEQGLGVVVPVAACTKEDQLRELYDLVVGDRGTGHRLGFEKFVQRVDEVCFPEGH